MVGPRRRVFGRLLVGVHARLFFRIFAVHFTGVFLALQLFLGMAALLVYLWTHPYLPPMRVLAAIPDQLLILLPITLLFSTLLAGLFFASAVRGRQGFLRIRMAGRDPRWCQAPILAAGAVVSAGLVWLLTSVLPVVQYEHRYPRISEEEAGVVLPLLLLTGKELSSRITVRAEALSGGELRRLAILSVDRGRARVVTADRARFRIEGEPPRVRGRFRSGRVLALDRDSQLTENIRFDALDLDVDPIGGLRRPKSDFLSLAYYTNTELRRLPELVRTRTATGLAPTPRQERRLAAIPFLVHARWQLALAPLVLLGLIVLCLGGHVGAAFRYRTVLIALAGICVYFPQALLFVQRPIGRGLLAQPWVAWSPLAETILLIGLGVLLERLVRRGR